METLFLISIILGQSDGFIRLAFMMQHYVGHKTNNGILYLEIKKALLMVWMI
jgi:hypothetical protein